MTALRARLRRLAVAATAIAATLMPAGPAHAAADGTGWSSGWLYTSDTTFHFSARLPGAVVGGDGTDSDGTRSGLAAYVQDTSNDGVCVRGLAVAATGVLFDGTVCDGQPTQYFYPGAFSGSFSYTIFRVRPDGSGINSHATWVPDSASDPGLRHSGTGASWQYWAPGVILFSLTRNGVQFHGRGDVSGSARSTYGTIVRTGSSDCASGSLTDGTTVASNDACAPNWWADTPLKDFRGTISVRACASGACVDGLIPEAF